MIKRPLTPSAIRLLHRNRSEFKHVISRLIFQNIGSSFFEESNFSAGVSFCWESHGACQHVDRARSRDMKCIWEPRAAEGVCHEQRSAGYCSIPKKSPAPISGIQSCSHLCV